MASTQASQPADSSEQGKIPLGFKLRYTLHGHEGTISRIAWSPDGRVLASGSNDHTIRLWEMETAPGTSCHVLAGHTGWVYSVAWSPDGNTLASSSGDKTVRLWDTASGSHLLTLEGHTDRVFCLAWSPDGRTLASGSGDNTIRLWDPQTGQVVQTLYGHVNGINELAWSQEWILASGSYDQSIRLWDGKTGELIRILLGHTAYVTSVVWSPDGRVLASCAEDKTIRLWDPGTGRQTMILEGHTARGTCVSFSFNGQLLASKSWDGTIRLWRGPRWDQVITLHEPSSEWWPVSLRFHPTRPVLATLGEGDTVIRIWNLDVDVLLGDQSVTEGVRYTTAKLVLVGDSGVGKTGLGWRLAHGKFKEHASTHGQQFWIVNQLRTKRQDGTECEAVLWDLAGQPIYGTVHAIFLDDVDLSLMLFDPTNRQEPLKGVEFWLEQLSGKQQLPPTVLVGARVDRGAPVLSQQELDQFCQRHGISGGYISTSAMTGVGLDQLLDLLKTQIPWEQMTTTVTTVTFKRIKEYVLALKEKPDRPGVLVRPTELRQQLEAADPQWQFTDAEMMTAVKHLENHGYVIVLRSSSGEESILLAPELLVNLASSIVLQADKHPRELGALSETVLLQGGYAFPELANLAPEEGHILLDAAVVRFLSHNILFRETLGAEALLIFPRLIKQKRPLLDEVETVEDMSYILRGRVENVYAALVVLLGYTPTFTRIHQWQNQAQYELGKGEICGFRLIEERKGEIELVLYYSAAMPIYGRSMFQGLFEQFLYQHDVDVRPFPPVICPGGHLQPRVTVINLLREGLRSMFCAKDGKEIALPETGQPLGALNPSWIQQEEAVARLRIAYETNLVPVKGFRRDRAAPCCYISHMPEQASWALQLARDLREAGVRILDDTAQIQANDFIIMVGTPAYKQAWERSAESVASDADLIRTRLRQPATSWPTLIPLLLEGNLDRSLPHELRSHRTGDFRNETHYAVSLFDLVLTLYAFPLNHPAFERLREALQKQWEETLGGVENGTPPGTVKPAMKIFISYAHPDEEFKDALVTMLAGLQGRGIIDVWQDRRIEGGDEWYQSIQDAMNECGLALLLVSAHFLASRFIQDKELPRLLQRRKDQGLRVVPIIVRPCPWQSEPVLRDLQALPRDGKPVITFPNSTGERDQVWTEIAKAIETRAQKLAEELRKPTYL